MGRTPCCEKQGLKKGPWTEEEDRILVDYIQAHGHGSWRSLPKQAGLLRCGKSCRLRWTNYLRPDIKRGPFTPEEQKSIIQLHGIVGNKWSTIAAQLPGRTDNEIKNYWNTHLKKQLLRIGLNPDTYTRATSPTAAAPAAAATRHMAQWESARLEAEARLSRESLLFSSLPAAAAAACSAVANSCSNSSSSQQQQGAEDMLEKSEPLDFFLRIWNSEIGDVFRMSRTTGISRDPMDPSLDSSLTKLSSTAAAAAASEGQERREETESKSSTSTAVNENTLVTAATTVAAATGSDSCSSYGADEDASEETYQLYLDFAGDDMELFHGQLSRFSLFSDLTEASLDTAFT